LIQDKVLMPISESACGLHNHHPGNAGYDGQGKKITTYPRAEVRYLPQSLISDVPRIVAGLRAGQSFSAIPVPEPPVIRKGGAALSTTRGWRVRAITPSCAYLISSSAVR
jgi:hypothetical protein